jgi:hypothetical protein
MAVIPEKTIIISSEKDFLWNSFTGPIPFLGVKSITMSNDGFQI